MTMSILPELKTSPTAAPRFQRQSGQSRFLGHFCEGSVAVIAVQEYRLAELRPGSPPSPSSVITSKANSYHFKTGQRKLAVRD